MVTTTFAVRQFYTIPPEEGTFTAPTGVFVVTGSVSRLLVNNTRTNLASDSMSITTQFSNPYVANSGTSQGWWPAGTTAVFEAGVTTGGIIVGGNDTYANSSPDSRTSNVSLKGYKNGTLQQTNTVAGGTSQATDFTALGALTYKTGSTIVINYSSKELAFASIGDGLTDAEAANFYTAVQAFQTTLGRQV